jgi:hypothetical protein
MKLFITVVLLMLLVSEFYASFTLFKSSYCQQLQLEDLLREKNMKMLNKKSPVNSLRLFSKRLTSGCSRQPQHRWSFQGSYLHVP